MTARTERRFVLRGIAAVGAAIVATLWKPLRALAAEWPKPAFESRQLEEAIRNLFGTTQTAPSASLRLNVPPQAEDGASVRCAVSTSLPNVTTIALFVEKNERPLIMAMNFSANAQPYFSLRVKMAQTSDVYAIAKSQGKLYSAKQTIKVTVGGCGG
jgi:sulfur-oxidizing protein SoxY